VSERSLVCVLQRVAECYCVLQWAAHDSFMRVT